jgi:hypothetical protein
VKINYRTAVLAILVVMILLPNPALLAWGNPVPGRWEKVAETEQGAKITVYRKDGARQSCRYRAIDDQFLICADQDDNAIQIEKVFIDKIILHRGGSFAKKWAIWGAVGGTIGGAIFSLGLDFVPSGRVMVAGIGACLGALGAGLAGGTVASLGGPIYISKEAALARASQD